MDLSKVVGGYTQQTSQQTPANPVQQLQPTQPQPQPQPQPQVAPVAEQLRYNFETATMEAGETYYGAQQTSTTVDDGMEWDFDEDAMGGYEDEFGGMEEYSEQPQQNIQTTSMQQPTATPVQEPVQMQTQPVQQPTQPSGQPQQMAQPQAVQQPVQQNVQAPVQQPVQPQANPQPQQSQAQQPKKQGFQFNLNPNFNAKPRQQSQQAQPVQAQNNYQSNYNGFGNNGYANNGYGNNSNQTQGYTQYNEGYEQNPNYRTEPDFYPMKAINNIVQKNQAMEVLLDGMNLANYEDKLVNGVKERGRRISFDSKFHINFWTFDEQMHRKDYLPIYGDMSKLAGIMQCVLNGSIFQMTNAARAEQQQKGSQYCSEIWKSEGGTTKSQNYTIDCKRLQPKKVIATRLMLIPANAPNTWLLSGAVYDGKIGRDGAIFPSNLRPLKRVNIKFNYVELCSLATYILDAIQADMTALAVRRAFES